MLRRILKAITPGFVVRGVDRMVRWFVLRSLRASDATVVVHGLRDLLLLYERRLYQTEADLYSLRKELADLRSEMKVPTSAPEITPVPLPPALGQVTRPPGATLPAAARPLPGKGKSGAS